jgi:hypothetical protein
MRVALALMVGIHSAASVGQDAALLGGHLTVEAGTTVSFLGPVNLNLSPGAGVTNHGLIDLGGEGMLAEAQGYPITGSGFERALRAEPGPLAGEQPGGLGLTISSAYAQGGLTVERGHLPRTSSNGSVGIARWYRVTTPVPTAEGVEIALRYDATELSGILPSALAVFAAPSPDGPWLPLATSNDIPSQTLLATGPAPETHFTAFDLVGATGAAILHMDKKAFLCWPSPFEDQLRIEALRSGPIDRIEVLDGQGRVLRDIRPEQSRSVLVQLPGLPPGAYIIRVNQGQAMLKAIRE